MGEFQKLAHKALDNKLSGCYIYSVTNTTRDARQGAEMYERMGQFSTSDLKLMLSNVTSTIDALAEMLALYPGDAEAQRAFKRNNEWAMNLDIEIQFRTRFGCAFAA